MVIAKTDADGVGKELGNRFGVTGFPSESTSTCSQHPVRLESMARKDSC